MKIRNVYKKELNVRNVVERKCVSENSKKKKNSKIV